MRTLVVFDKLDICYYQSSSVRWILFTSREERANGCNAEYIFTLTMFMSCGTPFHLGKPSQLRVFLNVSIMKLWDLSLRQASWDWDVLCISWSWLASLKLVDNKMRTNRTVLISIQSPDFKTLKWNCRNWHGVSEVEIKLGRLIVYLFMRYTVLMDGNSTPRKLYHHNYRNRTFVLLSPFLLPKYELKKRNATWRERCLPLSGTV